MVVYEELLPSLVEMSPGLSRDKFEPQHKQRAEHLVN